MEKIVGHLGVLQYLNPLKENTSLRKEHSLNFRHSNFLIALLVVDVMDVMPAIHLIMLSKILWCKIKITLTQEHHKLAPWIVRKELPKSLIGFRSQKIVLIN
jgi:hypothetical protein